jgi:hypothetical protein
VSAPAGTARLVRSHPLAVAVAISVALSAAYLLWQPQTLDLAAQTFRADLWEREGFVIWNPDWYGGHLIPGYSLLYPPLGAWLSPELLGAVSAVAAAALFGLIALGAYGQRAWLGVVWFGAASTVALFGGRITFGLGLAIGLGCLLAIQRDRTIPALLLAAAAALASPVAGLFTGLACVAVLAARRSRWETIGAAAGPIAPALAGAIGSAAALAALALAFPTDGYQPFAFSAWIWIPLTVAALLVLTRSDEAILRWGALLYLALATAALLIDTPLGGNAVRLGATLAGPLLAIVLWRRPVVLALLAVPLLWWQWTATVRDIAAADGDRSTAAAYYEPLLAQIGSEARGLPVRVRVPPTRNRTEAVDVAERFQLDGGWMRQLEAEDADFLEQQPLERSEYESWLSERGIAYLAVSDVEPDRIAEGERELLEAGGLDGAPVLWENEHWRLYAIGDPGKALVAGTEPPAAEAEVLAVDADGFTVRTDAASLLLDFGYTPYFRVVSGDGCVEGAGGSPRGGKRTRLVLPADGRMRTLRVEARLSLDGLLRRGEDCG